MALPKIDLPVYDMTIPSSGKVVQVRPFTVKEEKLLLIAIESKNQDEIVKTVKQVINNCLVSGEANVDKLPFFDIDFMFIFLRAKSIGETVEVNLTCNNEVEGERCGNVFPTDMDISKCDIDRKDISDDIKLDTKRGVKMKYPNYSSMKALENSSVVDQKTAIIINSIDHIYDDKGVYSANDHSKDELREFVEGLTEENFKKLEAFVDNFPTFAVKLEATCTKCGFHHTVRYTDFYDFFF